ncbi:hypothetical protein FRX31_026915 [Thalictrum thalictroides]|uniref:Uncharacterized protein n=1 Tax=Thalictrum thalictroides TaxID=46969 RepID=A0A7J6VFZ0_THATH|nr:hypothetical protein FRX31_026915 [Thalictrum thalictroides]
MPYISISERVKDSVRRSMCEVRFDAFTDFHNNIGEFGEKMNSESLPKHAHLLAFFPIPPSKVGKHNWLHFRSCDSELTEQNDEDELDSAAKDEQSLTPTLGCNRLRLSK